MATYPNDATLSVTAFSVIGESTFTDTGPNTTNFALPSTVSHRGEIAAFIDGVLQATTSYDLADSGATASFLTAPNASVLVLKTISLPPRFRANRTFPAVRAVDFNATTAVVINSVSYLINGSRTAFAFPEGVTVTAKSEFLVFVSGVQQQESAFTFPSSSLGNAGIDIDDDGSALDAPDTLSIRVFDSSVTSFDRFYNERSGEFESFVFDLSHINDSGTINARFSGTLKVAQVLSNGAGLLDNFYTVSFELQETFD
jgi:hypothetical protein